MGMKNEKERHLLYAADVFYDVTGEEWDEEEDGPKQVLNMNDTFGWALAFGQTVTDDDLPKVSRLFSLYGQAGLIYWVSEKNEGMRSRFFDVNRGIDFVKKEEALIDIDASNSHRAYTKIKYTVGRETFSEWRWRIRRKFWLRLLPIKQRLRDLWG